MGSVAEVYVQWPVKIKDLIASAFCGYDGNTKESQLYDMIRKIWGGQALVLEDTPMNWVIH